MAQFPNATAADGIWTLKKVRRAILGNNWPAVVLPDEFFANTVLLLQGDTFLETMRYNIFGDASTNAHDITPVGGVHGTPFSPYNNSWSVEFDGNDWLNHSDTTAGAFGTSDFTVEFWLYDRGTTNNFAVVISGYNGNNGQTHWGIQIDRDADGNIYWYSSINLSINSTIKLTRNKWTHIAVVRNSGTTTMYVNGQSGGSFSDSTDYISPSGLGISRDLFTSNYFVNGYISNLRLVKGTAVYTSAFTPPTEPLTAISGTSLLICNANRFIDTSSNAHAITVNGNPEIKGFSPFADTDTVTGSGYFDGSGDYLQTDDSDDFGTGDFTVEAWVYPTIDSGSDRIIVDTRTSASDTGFVWFLNSAEQLSVYTSAGIRLTSSTSLPVNSWSHVVFTRESGTIEFFINGVSDATASYSTTITSPNNYRIGARNDLSASVYFNGYMANLRIVTGTAVYTTNFTPPTSPLTAVSGTSLLTLQNRGANRNIGFIDSSHPTRQITRNGNVTQGSFSPFSQDEGKWGNYFDGTNDYFTMPDSDAFHIGQSDFTIDFWLNKQPTSTYQHILRQRVSSSDEWCLILDYSATGGDHFEDGALWFEWGPGKLGWDDAGIPNNEWCHVAVTRSGTTATLYVNGVSKGTRSMNDITNVAAILYVAAWPDNSLYRLKGYLSNLRIVKGTVVYTSAFTPSTDPSTAITNTSLLTCQSNRFVDNSSNAHAITVSGNPEVVPFSPFAPSTAYNPATKGGSAYFDGTSDDYITVSDATDFDFGTGDFTVECWFYEDSLVASFVLLGATEGANQYWGYGALGDGGMTMYAGSSGTDIYSGTSNTPQAGQWNHLVWQRGSGTASMYINGERVYNASYTADFGSSATGFRIGRSNSYTDYYANGKISDFRVVKGSAVYSGASFTPSTAPLTAVNGTSLLCNFTNAGIYDGTGRNVLETVGDAHVENSVKKYGTGSMEFGGTTDRLITRGDSVLLGTGDFTIEMWVYFNSVSDGTVYTLLDGRTSSDTSNLMWAQEASGGWTILNGSGSNIASGWTSGTFSSGQWYHVAQTRENGVSKFFVNGTQTSGNLSDTSNYDSVEYSVGGRYAVNGSSLNGYIDDLRITKGVARYTANFTPPAAKLEQQ